MCHQVLAVGVTLGDGTQEETDTVECHAGETLPTIDEIKQHCHYALEPNLPPFTMAGTGLMRKHVKNNGTSHHVLSYDLAGPHPATCGA